MEYSTNKVHHISVAIYLTMFIFLQSDKSATTEPIVTESEVDFGSKMSKTKITQLEKCHGACLLPTASLHSIDIHYMLLTICPDSH